MNQKIAITIGVIIILAAGVYLYKSRQTAEAPGTGSEMAKPDELKTEEDLQKTKAEFKPEKISEGENGEPTSSVKLEVNGKIYDLGTVKGTCSKQNIDAKLSPAEIMLDGIQCWWAGAGDEFVAVRIGKVVQIKRRAIQEEDTTPPLFNPGAIINLETNTMVQ